MAKLETTTPVVTGIEDAGTTAEIIAQAILDVDAAMKKMVATGLRRRALITLIKDASVRRLSYEDIGNTLDAIERLAVQSLTPERLAKKAVR